MATAAVPKSKISGGSFLLEERTPDEVFTPEDFTEQHQLIGQTAEEFATNEIVPNIEKMEHKDFSVTRELLKKAGELGLSGVEIPESYGGLEMDKVTAAVIADHIAKYAGFATTWGGHTGIGTLPIVYFGTEEQKKKYLPRLAAGEIVGAYALSEASSGSDALNCRARAEFSKDGKHYVLNGEKMWITNAGFADLFTVFAKVDGEKFTAFLVEKSFPGFSIGAEEHKMGIRGSSTCPIILNDCKVPAENVLGEIGKGHVIAFNILNVGRFKLGAMCVGGARVALENSVAYAKQRKAFGKVIADFGLVREKLANMAALIYVGESLVYRDARINRIFEGTNEINRLIITGFLLKRAMSGQLPLMPAIKKLMDEVLAGPALAEEVEGPLVEERKLVTQAKKLGLFAAGAATQKYMQAIQDQQEIMGAIADMVIESYAMESAVLRAQKIASSQGGSAAALPIAMTRVYLSQAMERIEAAARKIIAAVADGDMLRTQLAILRRLAKYEPFNTIELRQQIAAKVIERGKYVII